MHRTAPRDGRRRRVLMDERAAGNAAARDSAAHAEDAAASAHPRQTTTQKATGFMKDQARVTDLIPTRWTSLALCFVVGALVIAGLEGLYAWMGELAPLTTDGQVAAFDLDAEGSLGAWFSSAQLALCSAVCLLIYYVRRQRPDDYYGRYRIWLWAAVVWMVMSIDESASLHEGFKEMMVHLTGWRLVGDGSAWWAIAYGVVLGVLGLRLLLDMRGSRAATASFVLAGAAWAAAVFFQFELLTQLSITQMIMIEEGCEMAGGLLILMAMLLHARYVVLEAQGKLSERRRRHAPAQGRPAKAEARQAKKRAAAQPAEPEPPQRKQRRRAEVEAAEPDPQPASKRKQARIDAEEDDVDERHLSKRERRALRKKRRSQRELA